jgi:hypothetical protein
MSGLCRRQKPRPRGTSKMAHQGSRSIRRISGTRATREVRGQLDNPQVPSTDNPQPLPPPLPLIHSSLLRRPLLLSLLASLLQEQGKQGVGVWGDWFIRAVDGLGRAPRLLSARQLGVGCGLVLMVACYSPFCCFKLQTELRPGSGLAEPNGGGQGGP